MDSARGGGSNWGTGPAAVVSAPMAAAEQAAEPAVAEQAAESAVATVVVGGPGVQGLRVALEVAAVVGLHGVVGLLGAEDGVSRFAHHRAAPTVVNRNG